MSMSKKVYVDFARMIRTQRHKAQNEKIINSQDPNVIKNIIINAKFEQIDSIVEELADLFQSDNSNFQRAKFLAACEIDTE